MRAFFERFQTWFLALVAIVGFFLAAREEGAWWVGVPLGIALAFAGVPLAQEGWRRIRKYPALLRQAGVAQDELAQAEVEIERLTERESTAFRQGKEEGMREILGSLAAAALHRSLRLQGVTNDEAELVFIATSSETEVPLGARFDVQSTVTGAVKGTVEVIDFNQKEKVVRLRPIHRTVQEFWAALESRSAVDEGPPPGIVLVPADFSPPPPFDFVD